MSLLRVPMNPPSAYGRSNPLAGETPVRNASASQKYDVASGTCAIAGNTVASERRESLFKLKSRPDRAGAGASGKERKSADRQGVDWPRLASGPSPLFHRLLQAAEL